MSGAKPLLLLACGIVLAGCTQTNEQSSRNPWYVRPWERVVPKRAPSNQAPTPSQQTGQFPPPPQQAAAPPAQPEQKASPWYLRPWERIIPKRDQALRANLPIWVGTVKMVSPEGRFVLIDADALFAVRPGRELICFTENQESGKLRIGVERRSTFVIADILEGQPRIGDRVYAPEL